MNPPLHFAVIGCGAIAQGQHLPNIIASKRIKLQVCCDVSKETLAECQKRFKPARTTTDYREAIRDPEVQAVCIATTEKFRLPLIREAAEAGKAVYVEKPMAISLQEMRQIQNLVKQARIPFCLGHNRRCSPAMVEARRIFRDHMENPKPCPWRWDREGKKRPHLSEDGTPAVSVRVNDDWWSWKSWVFDKSQAPHGAMLFEMTHFTDVCNWFLADEAVEVVAMESGMLNHGIVVRYRHGGLATICMGANGTLGYPKELYEFMGHGGLLAVDHMVEIRTAGIEGAPWRRTFPLLNDPWTEIGPEGGINGWLAKRRVAAEEAVRLKDPQRVLLAQPDKGHFHILERFVDEILGDGGVVCGVDDGVKATLLAFAALRSAAERRVVRLDEIQG